MVNIRTALVLLMEKSVNAHDHEEKGSRVCLGHQWYCSLNCGHNQHILAAGAHFGGGHGLCSHVLG